MSSSELVTDSFFSSAEVTSAGSSSDRVSFFNQTKKSDVYGCNKKPCEGTIKAHYEKKGKI